VQDALFVLAVLAFFALATGAVHLCDRVVGAGEPQDADTEPPVVRSDQRNAA